MISKRQGDLRKHSFLERKKILHKSENGFTMRQNIGLQSNHSSISQNISKCLAYNAEKTLQLKIAKKELIQLTL